MTRIDFHSNVGDPLLHTCKLVRKAWAAGNQVVCYTQDTALLDALDKALWAFAPLEFVPHVGLDNPLAAETPILLASTPVEPPATHHQVLVNLDTEPPPYFSRFERLIEIVGRQEALKTAARTRYKFYRDRGYALAHHEFGET
jgi:DNA polymerase-3 subunit chi